MDRILVVEDDRELNQGICFALQQAGYETESAYSTQEAKLAGLQQEYSLMILDVNLPDGEGFGFCKWIMEHRKVKVMFLTARDLEEDVLSGYELGAEDYVTKPFSIHILLKKIAVILKRETENPRNIYEDGYLRIDFDRVKVEIEGKECMVTPTEFRMLRLFIEHAGQLLSYNVLLEQLWDCDEAYVDRHTLAVNVNRLRGKIEDAEHKYISNVYGISMVAIGIIAGCGIVISYLLVRLYRQKKEIYDFTEELQRCLTLMKAGEDIGNEAEFKDSLWDKIYQDLQELMDVWNRKNRQSHKEKEQIKELISDISHQGRTPMANIKIYLEILEEEQEDKVRRQECIGKLIKQTERLDFLMQSLVKLSHLETGIIEICEKDTKIFEVLGLAVAAVVPGAEAKEISVHVDCPETLKLFCDAKWTQEAIFNLLENAVKYTPKGGSIYISVMEQEVFGKISIRDTGRGIPAEHQAQIFQRFYREPEVHDEDGIGIGLYLARKIVTMQDGYMEVHSESGKGAEFCIYLPMK